MKALSILIVISSLLFLNGGAELEGKWMMFKVIQEGKDVTSEHNPNKDRYIILNSDGGFKSGGTPGENTGKYTLVSSDTLYLDSDVGPNDDSQWVVKIHGDTMFWQGFGTEWAEDFQLIHLRADQ